MTQRQVIRRGVASVLTFVFVSLIALLAIPWIQARGVESNNDAYRFTSRDCYAGQVSTCTLWGLSFLSGVSAGVLVWIPTTQQHSFRRRQHR